MEGGEGGEGEGVLGCGGGVRIVVVMMVVVVVVVGVVRVGEDLVEVGREGGEFFECSAAAGWGALRCEGCAGAEEGFGC